MLFNSFKEYCLLREMAARKQISRIENIAKDQDRFMVMISASRFDDQLEKSKEVFPGATKSLEKDIRARGYTITTEYGVKEKELSGQTPIGITPTLGGYPEGNINVREKSLLISLPKGSVLPSKEEVVGFFVPLAEKYQQLSVIIKFPGEVTAHEYTTKYHGKGPNNRIPYYNPHKEQEPMYFTKPRYRKKQDALVYNPDFDNVEKSPFEVQ